jgi:fimbrial chaperone protein
MNKIVIILKNILENFKTKYFYEIKIFSYFLILMSLPYFSWAGSFYIAPTKGELSEKSKYIVFEVKNTSENISSFQVQAMSWEIQNGEDVVKPTRDIIATPVIVSIKPNVKQIIRVGLNRKPDKEEELFYKILISEIPSLKQAEVKGTQITVEFSIPIILKATEKTKTNINLKSKILSDGNINLEIENEGKKHEIINSITFNYMDDQRTEVLKKYIYLRPKEKYLINLPINNLLNKKGVIKIILETENGNIESDADFFRQ